MWRGDGHWEWIRSKNSATSPPSSFSPSPPPWSSLTADSLWSGPGQMLGRCQPVATLKWQPAAQLCWPGGEQEFGMTPLHLNHCLLSLAPHPARGEPLCPPSQHHPVLHPQPFTQPQRPPSPPLRQCQAAPCSPSPGTAGWQSRPPWWLCHRLPAVGTARSHRLAVTQFPVGYS